MSLVNGIKGIFIGIALVIPGLSGSIFAVVVGLYEDILDAINNFKKNIKGSVAFLMPIAVGAAIGILGSTKAILWVCQAYPVWSYLFFVGLVFGSMPLVIKKARQIAFNPLYLLISLGAFFIILYLTALEGTGNESYIAIEALKDSGDFLTMIYAGIFSVSLMAIPGVSGSVMLMVINQYGTVYNSVGTSIDLIKYVFQGNWAMVSEAFNTVVLIIPFMIGALAGLIVVAKLMGYLLKHFEPQTYYGVGGVILAAAATLFKTGVIDNMHTLSSESSVFIIILGAVCVVVGFLCTVFLDKPSE